MKSLLLLSNLLILLVILSCQRAQIAVSQLDSTPTYQGDASQLDGSASSDRVLSDLSGRDLSSADLAYSDASLSDSSRSDARRPDTALPDIRLPDTGPAVDAYVPSGASLLERLQVSAIELAVGVRHGVSSWRIWGTASLGVAPVFTVPLSNGESLVGYTDTTTAAHAIRLNASDQLLNDYTLAAGRELRGLAAEPDGHFGALLWDDASDTIYVHRFDSTGTELWSEELSNSDNTPDDFGIGDSRLAFGNGRYGAYYHVHSSSGHEGDTLKWVDAETHAESTGWSWGCSHSMSDLLRYHPDSHSFLPVCATDCYPGTSGDFATNARGGIYLNHRTGPVLEMDAGCNGSVAGELGGLAPSSGGGWRLVFNAHQNPMEPGQSSYSSSTMNQDVAFVALSNNTSYGPVVWLTSTGDIDESDPTIAPWQPAGESTEQYIVGWAQSGTAHRLARVDAAGMILEGPVDISAQARWGKRDDPMRQHVNGDVLWSWFDGSGSTTLHLARLRAGNI